MAKLSDVQAKVRRSKKWGFLAVMLGETDIPQPTAGINLAGICLVNPSLAMELGTNRLVTRLRNEFTTARELGEVPHMR